jgi:hypothetical protein
VGDMVMGKGEEKKESSTLLKQIVNILKEDMENYH